MKDWSEEEFRKKFKPKTEKEIEMWEKQLKFIKVFRPMKERARIVKYDFEKYIKELKKRGIPEPKAMKMVKKWSKTDKRILFLSSPPGTGKTFAAAFYLYQAWKRAWEQGYENWSMFFVKERELFGPLKFKDDLREGIIECIRGAQLLVIDDFGQVTPTSESKIEEMRAFYESLFDERRIMKPVKGLKSPRLILTTNLTKEEVKKLPYLSKRVLSRVESISLFMRFEDRDYRSLGFPDFLPSEPKL